MVELEEGEFTTTSTSVLIDTSVIEGYSCWVKGQYIANQWALVPMYPNLSNEISFEDFKEKCRIQVSRTVQSEGKYLTLKFCKVVL